MASLIIISWRDVPAQVIVKRGRETHKVQLSHRFQEAVDRAAMRAGKGGSDAYLADWVRSAPTPCGDDLQAVAEANGFTLDHTVKTMVFLTDMADFAACNAEQRHIKRHRI